MRRSGPGGGGGAGRGGSGKGGFGRGDFGGGGAWGGVHAPKAKRWLITGSLCPNFDHTINPNLTLTFGFGHASHVG